MNPVPNNTPGSLPRGSGIPLRRVLLGGWLSLFTLVACEEPVAPLTDEELKEQWLDIPDQCMGFEDKEEGIYRVYPADEPNPKGDDPCWVDGGTAPGGHCNVPCGFSRAGEEVGNKNCECSAGFFVSCSCDPLPSVAEEIEPFVKSCELEDAAPAEWDFIDTFAKQMQGASCETEYHACIAPDLPQQDSDGVCTFTTPKGCICLGGFWQCGSTNSWFHCLTEDCPESFNEAGAYNGDLKNSTLCSN